MAEQETFAFAAKKAEPGASAARGSSPKKAKAKRSRAPKPAKTAAPAEAEVASASPTAEAKPARSKGGSRATAHDLAKQQREISVAEFFAKNRHLLGFDNPAQGACSRR